MLDFPEDAVRETDREDMLGRVLAYPELLQRALDNTRDLNVSLPRVPSRILVVGMGGSAIGGDYLASWLDVEGSAPILVSRNYELPNWVDKDTLVLAFSYSGNTEETLAAFAGAKKKGAMLAAMATGNRLKELALSYGAPFVAVEGGMQPRAALPHTFGTAAMLLDRLGLLKAEKALEATLKQLSDVVVEVSSEGRNEAKRIALAIQDTVPVIYSASILTPAGRRFANQLNENSKVLAFHGVMPEMNHNELVAWAGDDDLDRFTTLFLRHSQEHVQARERFDFTASLIQGRGGRVVQVEAKGSTVPEILITSSLVGDAVSVYLAALRHVDPTPVKVITELKSKVGETGFVAGIK